MNDREVDHILRASKAVASDVEDWLGAFALAARPEVREEAVQLTKQYLEALRKLSLK